VDTREPGEKAALINPEIVWMGEELTKMKEGCLSIPGVEGEVMRPAKVRVKGLGVDGKPVEIAASGLFARVFQHEIDHLNGIVFVDQVSQAELERLQPLLAEFDTCAVV
jgi:peptide deformylase